MSRRWSDDDKQEIVNMVAMGYSKNEIASHFDCPITRFNSFWYYHHFAVAKPRQRWNSQTEIKAIELRKQGLSYKAIGDKLGYTQSAICSHLKNKGLQEYNLNGHKYWTAERQKELELYICHGWTVKKLANYFGRSEEAIKQRMSITIGTESLKKARKIIREELS